MLGEKGIPVLDKRSSTMSGDHSVVIHHGVVEKGRQITECYGTAFAEKMIRLRLFPSTALWGSLRDSYCEGSFEILSFLNYVCFFMGDVCETFH